ncbi:MAG: DUF2470 domain-containing protein [Bacteroidota bacterium]
MTNTSFGNRKFMDYAIQHVNEDHQKEMLLVVKHFARTDSVVGVVLLDYNEHDMDLQLSLENGQTKNMKLQFPKSLSTPQEFRPVLVDMVKTARKNPSNIKL